MVWLISYPRSGTNWTAYIIENVCRLPVIAVHASKSIVYNEEVHNSSACIIHKSHVDNEKFIYKYNKETDNLICIVRNYKESVVGHGLAKFNFERFKDKTKGQGSFDYMSVLKIFDENNNDKLLIYYEDLLSNPEIEINKIVAYCKQFGGKTDCNEFINNITEHRRKSLLLYGMENSKSKGEYVHFYSKKLTDEMKAKMDEHLQNKFPVLFEKYLKRYL